MPCTSASTLTSISSIPVLPQLTGLSAGDRQALTRWGQQILAQIQAAGGATGVNVIPQQYALVAGSALPPIASTTNCTVTLDATTQLFGAGSYKIALTGTPATVEFSAKTAWPLQPNWQWIISFFQTASAAVAGSVTITTAGGTAYSTTFTTGTAGLALGRLFDVLNLGGDGSASFGLSFTFTGGTGQTVWLDGFQLEPYFGRSIQPSPFISTSPPLLLDNNPDGFYSKIMTSRTSGNVAYNFRGVWSSTADYLVGDETVYQTSYWLCVAANTDSAPSTSNANWQVVGSYSGYEGAWNSTVAYIAGAEVTYSGNYWVCVTANTDSAPSTSNANWVLAGPLNLDNVADGTSFVRLLASHASGNVAYNFQGLWSSTASYLKGDEVVYETSYWLCLVANSNSAPSTSNADWQVVGSYSGYQGAWSSTTAYVAGAEVTYNGNYWICVTANTDSAPTTTNANWVMAGPQALDYIADGPTTYYRVPLSHFDNATNRNINLTYTVDGTSRFAVVNGAGLNGASAVDAGNNPRIDFSQSFHLNKTQDYIPNGATFARVPFSNANMVTDSEMLLGAGIWNLGAGASVVQNTSAAGHGGNALSVPYNEANDITSAYIPCLPGATYTLSSTFDFTHLIGSGTTMMYLQAYVYDSALAQVQNVYASLNTNADIGGPSGCTASQGEQYSTYCARSSITFTTPSNGAFIRVAPQMGPDSKGGAGLVYAQQLEAGSTPSAYVPNNAPAVTQDKVLDGATYARFPLSSFNSLSDRRVSTANNALAPNGSVPPFTGTISLSYTSTTSSVTWSWSAFTIYRMDGTTTSVNSGSLEVTGLAASTTYAFYPYVDEATATVGFATGYANGVGTPAAAYTAASPAAGAFAANYANAPIGVLSAATPASGTGGGGGNLICCLNGVQPVERADGSEVYAADLKVGDMLTSPSGPVRIKHVKQEPYKKWAYIAFSNGAELTVVEDHRFIDPAGEEVRASDLHLNQIIESREGPVTVAMLEAIECPGVKVSVEVGAPHVYYVQGILSHNKEAC